MGMAVKKFLIMVVITVMVFVIVRYGDVSALFLCVIVRSSGALQSTTYRYSASVLW